MQPRPADMKMGRITKWLILRTSDPLQRNRSYNFWTQKSRESGVKGLKK